MDIRAWTPQVQAMMAYHHGQHDATVVVHDDYGDRDEIPASYFFRALEDFAPCERAALARCRGRVLDVGAGSGCLSLALQARGLDVCALEVAPELVELLRDRGVRDARCGDVTEFAGERFDTVLLMTNGLGLAETLSGLDRLLRHLHDMMAPGGQVVADSTDVRAAYGAAADGAHPAEGDDGRYVGEITFQLEFAGHKGTPFPQLFVDPHTLSDRAGAAGWAVEPVCTGEHGTYVVCLTER